jgi:hypothetical protein
MVCGWTIGKILSGRMVVGEAILAVVSTKFAAGYLNMVVGSSYMVVGSSNMAVDSSNMAVCFSNIAVG